MVGPVVVEMPGWSTITNPLKKYFSRRVSGKSFRSMSSGLTTVLQQTTAPGKNNILNAFKM